MTQSDSDSAEARSLSSMLSDFIGVVAHNIHTPVGSIKWSAETLIKGDAGKLTEEQKKIVQDIYDAADRLNDLSRTILYVYELEKDMPLVKQTEIAPVDILARVQGSLATLIEKRRASIIIEESTLSMMAYADPDIAFMILRILIENALCYSADDSDIHIAARQDGSGTTFTVEDHGIGIGSDNRPFIFRKFYRAPGAKRLWTDGVGLNLYIAHNLATRTGGALSFVSEEGKGSVFSWFIPAHKQRKEAWER